MAYEHLPTSLNRRRYEHLGHLLGAYYHEDFDGVWETFDLYLRQTSDVIAVALAGEIGYFLADTEVAAIPEATWTLGSTLWLGEQPEPYLEWLSEMSVRALTHADQTTAGDAARSAQADRARQEDAAAYPQLKILMAGYYHQDWVELGLWETMDEYLNDSSLAERSRLVADIDLTLESVNDDDLYQHLRGLGGYVLLDADRPGGYRGWLTEISRRARPS